MQDAMPWQLAALGSIHTDGSPRMQVRHASSPRLSGMRGASPGRPLSKRPQPLPPHVRAWKAL